MTHHATLDPILKTTSESEVTRVLIVDDEPCISDLLCEMLEMLGYSATKCFSPAAALQLLEQQEFDVVLSDFRMPHMNGDEFFRRAIARKDSLRSRFVFLTGDTESEDAHRFLTEYGSRHLAKPFDIASVNQVIADIVDEQAVGR
jgi:CheY-like chemotaxis protein